MNIGTLTVSLGLDLTQLNKATTALNTTAQKFRTFGYLASAALTYPMVMAGKASFNMAKDYEFAIQKIVGLTGEAQSAVNGFSDEILRMSPQIGKGPKELAEALYYISSSGVKGAEAMKVLELSARAATAGMGDTQTMASVLTSALNAYRGTGLTAAYATDVLVAAVREGKAEASGFSTAMGQLIPIAAQMGVSFDQVAGGMAAITLTGASAANAAVYLKGVFNSLLTASTQGEKALNQMGSSYAELRNILANKGLIALMQKLRDMQTQYGDELLSDVLPNIRALTGYLSLAGKNFQYNTELMKRVTESTGSLGKAFAAVADTIKVRYDQAISQAQVSLISLGKNIATSFLPLLDYLVKALTKLTNWFNNLSEEERKHKLVIAAVILGLGPLSMLISVLIYSLSGLRSAIVMVSNAWKIWNAGIIITQTVAGATTVTVNTLTFAYEGLGVAISAAAASVAKFVFAGLGIGAVVTAAWPLIQNLIDKIKELKQQIQEAKNVLGYSDRGMELDVLIGKRMSVLNKMNQDELGTTKVFIAERIALEREKLLNAEATGRKEIENEAFVLEKKKEIAKQEQLWAYRTAEYKRGVVATEDYNTWGSTISLNIQKANNAINEYIKNRQAEVAYDKIATQDTIDFYTRQGLAVDGYIKKVENIVATTKAKMEELEKLKINIGIPIVGPPIPTTFPGKQNYGGMSPELREILLENLAFENTLDNIQNVVSSLENTFADMFTAISAGSKSAFADMAKAFARSLQQMAAQMAAKAVIFGLLKLLSSGGTGGIADIAAGLLDRGGLKLTDWLFDIKQHANGTNNAPGGWSLVGERGPELVNLPRGAQVLPNHMLGAGLGNQMSGEVVFTIAGTTLVGVLQNQNRKSNSFR